MTKYFVISDVHGYATLLKQALEEAGFDPHDPNHMLIGCGDYFDRGTENREVLTFLESIPNRILLRGNHEDLLEKVLKTGKMEVHNFINGTPATIRSFFGPYALGENGIVDTEGRTSTVNWLCEFFDEMLDFYETEDYIFVHGWLPVQETAAGVELLPRWQRANAQEWAKARWVRWTQMQGRCPMPEKTVICGHYPTFMAPDRSRLDSSIYYGDGFIAIDAGTAQSGKVNVLVLE